MSIIFGLDEKNVCKWTIVYVNKISNIRIILLSNRFAQAPHGRKILLSVDGVDCPFREPYRPVDPAYNIRVR